ncbi:dihydrodipicolinate synthase family protein [Conexibacter sp. JD483]|uniref:dihydrodipicolinate synthase family protein n=1 Tax=unclassified Conexibacter TaxID=2627773 RepID=UPI002724FA80|nr:MULTISPECIES: dihydrodipicolinate synthase family protein [unclassified Conexibacter]MDO8186579.1 dihydrodipicolinate synthase family protein [Conexibacter sp. CPCC 205706]MDO8196684.1 dihydrodipicolinate synthase family protein [Conexibacter sp. CPCC 205762]MDR9372662.1 dihydrodipicolinate synthase family protein [Conexibacter sp. JD483]
MPISGVLPVIPTPFRDGVFDRASFQRLLDHMLPWVDGYTLMGSTGEAPSLPDAQRAQIVAEALAMTPAGKTVVAGVSHTSADAAAELARHAQEHGAAGVLCCSPFYFANSPDGIYAHLARIDAAIEIELVLYDNPFTTKTPLQADWVIDWARRLSRLNSVKLTDHDLGKIPLWREAGLTVLAGDDPILSQFLAAGVDGAMVIAPAVLPESFATAWARMRAGDLDGALRIVSTELAPFIHAFGIGDEIATTKALYAEIGIFDSGELLSPLQPVAPARAQQLKQAYELGRDAGLARLAADDGAAAAPAADGIPAR